MMADSQSYSLEDWYATAQEYTQRTKDDRRDVYVALLTFIGNTHPRVMAEALRKLKTVYPDGINAAFEDGFRVRSPGAPPAQT